ncbi:MAG: DUF721 domain-containing protein [Flavobacteriales bacterium]|nr:DUF721 domain-containing protein [Flavobacteriales bacterium]
MEEEQPIKVLIEKLLSDYRLDAGLRERRVRDNWNRIVGDMIARNTRSVVIQDRKLLISVNSNVLRSELSFHKKVIQQKVNDFLGEPLITETLIK